MVKLYIKTPGVIFDSPFNLLSNGIRVKIIGQRISVKQRPLV